MICPGAFCQLKTIMSYHSLYCFLFSRLFRIVCLSLLFVVQIAGADTYRLRIEEKSVNLIGENQQAILANGTLPGPVLHWREGESVTLHVTNALKTETSIHWHGIILPYQMDGVPGISFPGIEPGETFTYRFQVNQSGTYWYHGHSGMQEQLGLFGALIIDPVHNHYPVERDYVVVLSDWPEADPERSMARLKKQSDYYNFQKRTVFDLYNDIERLGFWATVSDRLAWGEMRMEPTDLADITGATYHFLVNGQTPEKNWTALFKPGEKVRLRFINASAMTHFDIRIPGLKMRIIASDGPMLMPVNVDEFRIAVAETYDVLVEPEADRAYSIFAEAMDRSGYAGATLTPRSDLHAVLPELRPRTLLTMADMGPMHSGHDHQQMSGQADETNVPDHSGHQMKDMASMNGDHHDHRQMSEQDAEAAALDHSAHQMAEMAPMNGDHHDHQNMSGQSAEDALSPTPDHSAHADAPPANNEDHSHHSGHEPVMADETHKVLSYQDLQAATPSSDWKQPDHEITLRLTGNMFRYIWSFDDITYSDAEPIKVRFGDLIRFNYVNETMMNHPIHLHGLWQYLDNGKGINNPKKNVINVKPGKTVSVLVKADALGEWAFHCHLLYHMDTGMFRKLIVQEKPVEKKPVEITEHHHP